MNPVFFKLLDGAYGLINKTMPFLANHAIVIAPAVGGAASYYATKAGLAVSKRFPLFYEHQMPKIEKFIKIGLPVAAAAYAIVDPLGVKDLLMQHPVYTAGIVGAGTGVELAISRDLKKRQETNLEGTIKNREIRHRDDYSRKIIQG